MLKKITLIIILSCIKSIPAVHAQALIGYWHNWNDNGAPYIQLDQVDQRYSVICVSFAEPVSPSDMTMQFVPEVVSASTFASQIQNLQTLGKKVLISIGGANTSISLSNAASRNAFINSMNTILSNFPFDGIDIDIEHGNSILASGTILSPTSPDCINLIDAINQIKSHFLTTKGRPMMLTFAPETAYIQGGMSAYGGIWGGYLPIINAFRNDLSYVHVQLYNSGSMYGIDGNIYTQGTADFIIAMTEALIKGFNTAGGFFQGLPANKVVVGLPACTSAAGGGFTAPGIVSAAVKYIRGAGPKPGTYTLTQPGGYPTLGGMMTWSINWDKISTCNPTSYEFAQNYVTIFSTLLATRDTRLYATLIDTVIHLDWTTTHESGISFYEIQHAANGISFSVIDKKRANNNALATQYYQYSYKGAHPGNNYFRLKLIGADGRIEYSNIVNVAYMPANELAVYPNPVQNQLHLGSPASIYSERYRISTVQGQTVIEGNFNNRPLIETGNLQKGVYLLFVKNKVVKFIKG